MNTNELIAAMAADAKNTEMPIGRTLTLAVAAGSVVAALYFFMDVGTRPDLAWAFSSPRFLFKFALTLLLLVSSLGLVWHLARPGAAPIGWVIALAAVPALLSIGVVTELISLPRASWESEVFAMNWRVCMWLIPVLSAGPLVAVILALRHGAPTHPVLSGAAAGLLSAGIGASLYATHCQSDSPMFVAVWYVLATAIVTIIGALLGSRLLRW